MPACRLVTLFKIRSTFSADCDGRASCASSMSDLEDRGYLDESRGNVDPYLEGERLWSTKEFHYRRIR
jgi:hypothetical protein